MGQQRAPVNLMDYSKNGVAVSAFTAGPTAPFSDLNNKLKEPKQGLETNKWISRKRSNKY